jgi:hypothetical protein
MSRLFGGKQTTTPDYTGLQIQTAVNALPVPIVWGENKIAPNVIWYNGFQSIPPSSSGGGKGGIFGTGGGGSNSWTYTASVILALCEGPITGINEIWKDQSTYTLADLGLSLFTGTTPQSIWGFLETTFPSQALAYQGTAYVAEANYSLGTSATLSNHNFEVEGVFFGTGTNGIDADPAQVVSDFLTNAQYGVGFPSASIDASTLFGSGGDASYQTYCKAIGLNLSPALTNQEQASSILARWLQLTNTVAVWSGGLLKFIPYGDLPTTIGNTQSTSVSLIVPAAGTFDTATPEIYVCTAAAFVADGGVTYTVNGDPLTKVSSNPGTGQYAISPSGTYVFSTGDENIGVTISYSYSVAASYSPNVTPIYNLTDDDFKVENNEDPLQVSRSDPYEAYNIWRVEMAARANAYNLTTFESRDQNAIELYGPRIASTVTAHEICDPNVALLSGQLMLQRAVYIRNTYKFRLSWEYCLLDPMDIVAVTDTILGLSNAPIRITEIEEDENGFLQVTAEEFPLGVATAVLYPASVTGGAPIIHSVAADPVNTPVIFEPPAALVGSTPQVWIAASGGSDGVADPNWGGCNVFLSLDGTSYNQVGTINAPARQGVLTASLPAFTGTNPDTADTLAVNMADSGGVLATATDLDAQLGNTLCIVGDELVSYATSTLTSANNYALTYLYRGFYGTSPDFSFPVGTPFARLDSAVFEYELPAQYVGVELYIKLQSFNVFGGGVQELSTCAAYTYTPTGGATDHPVGLYLLTGTPLDMGLVTGSVIVEDDFGTPFTLPVEFDVDLGAA